MDEKELRERVEQKRLDRARLAELLERQDLGVTLKQDVTHAIEEIDELIAEFELTFPAR
jgi:hypothetical protein